MAGRIAAEMEFDMKKLAVVCSIALAALVGCSNKNKSPNASVTEVSKPTPTPTPAPPPVVVQPAPQVQPVISDSSPVVTTAAATPTPAITGNVYTVQKGDTLSKIARAKYGDLSAVRKIKEANPGINPDQLKPGQKINLP
jgi:nucleoid-associated protein YgaU